MSTFLIYFAYAALLLIPLTFFFHYLYRPPMPQPVPTITALLFLRWGITPVTLYAAMFLLCAVIEELSGTRLISSAFQHSLLIVIAVGIPWTLVLTLIVLAVASHRFRNQ
jgi:hypothetical protein